MAGKPEAKTNGRYPGASPGREPTKRAIARLERFIAERKPLIDAMRPGELDAMFEEAMAHVDKEQFLREAEALREQMKERQAARLQDRPERSSAKRNRQPR